MNKSVHQIIAVLAFVLLTASCSEQQRAQAQDQNLEIKQDFVSSSTVNETREQIAKLPKDDIWWTVSGEDQLWNFKNLHRFMPTVNLYRDGPVRTLENVDNAEIASYQVDTATGSMAFEDFIKSDHTTLMGLVILHKGKITYEAYPRQEPYEKPVYWSVAKVFASSVLAILEDRGEVDVEQPIDHYIPELKGSSYEGIKIRNVLDMATGV
ncbi:MAG: serine hydrolase, partial [Emcibacteraceae bacterium]|nr:serine hydrolase [Emcibacteraceae bacterium]